MKYKRRILLLFAVAFFIAGWILAWYGIHKFPCDPSNQHDSWANALGVSLGISGLCFLFSGFLKNKKEKAENPVTE